MKMEFLLWPMIFLLLGVLVTLCTLQLLVYLDGTRPKHRRSIFAPKRPKYAAGREDLGRENICLTMANNGCILWVEERTEKT